MKYIPKDGILFKIPPRLGDTVLMEPILRAFLSAGIIAEVDSPYAAIFDSQGWARLGPNPLHFDMECLGEPVNRVRQYHQKVFSAGYEVDLVAGLPRIDNIVPICADKKLRVGLIPGAGDDYKRWPYWELLAHALKPYGEIYSFDKYITVPHTISHTGLSIHELIGWLASMSLIVANDTGPAHLGAALGIPILVLLHHPVSKSLYEPYHEIVETLAAHGQIHTLPVRQVLHAACRLMRARHIDLAESGDGKRRLVVSQKKEIALFRLDGLGGTVTLLDQATKVHRVTGKQVTLITRGYEPLLISHPSVKLVRNVGSVDWFECLAVLQGCYDALADIRLAVGKWYGRAPVSSPRILDDIASCYYHFPHQMVSLEHYGLHQIQLADKTLGLPYDTIESYTYTEGEPVGIKGAYILVSTGVDAIHHGRAQTKQWGYWNEALAPYIKDVVQVGTQYDVVIPGATDLRGKTSLTELVWLVRNAHIVICCEGGIMHLAYSCKHPRTIVLRGPTRGKLFEYPGIAYIDSYVCQPCWSTDKEWVWSCPQKVDAVCMRSISAERVQYHINRFL